MSEQIPSTLESGQDAAGRNSLYGGEYPLSSTTLSSALGTDTNVPIAPELIGEGGMPPDSKKSPALDPQLTSAGQNVPGSGYPGFANSNARGDDQPWGEGGDDYSRTASDWQNNYRADQYHYAQHEGGLVEGNNGEHVEMTNAQVEDDGGEEGRKPKKRPRVSKPRQSKIDKEDPLAGAQVEWEDPSQDPKAGPVFIHPPPGTAQACVRCHRIKRKCDQARPRCQGCGKADVPCVFELSPATSTFVSNLKADNTNLSSQITSAHQRIAQLEELVATYERTGQIAPSFDDRGLFDRQFQESLPAGVPDFATLAQTILSVRSGNAGYDSVVSASNAQRAQIALPPYDVAMTAVSAFFDSNALAYPFLDKAEIDKTLDELFSRHVDEAQGGEIAKGKEFNAYMVIAIGSLGREGAELDGGSAKAYKDKALGMFSAAAGQEDIPCIQALLLLAIYGLSAPSDIPVWQVVGFAMRTAVALNLHRKVEGSDVKPEVVAQRSRIFWSVYNLERLLAFTLSRPVSLDDSDISVEVPVDHDEATKMCKEIQVPRYLAGDAQSRFYCSIEPVGTRDEAGVMSAGKSMQATSTKWAKEFSSLDIYAVAIDPASAATWAHMVHHQLLSMASRPSPALPTSTAYLQMYESSARVVTIALDLLRNNKVRFTKVNMTNIFKCVITLLFAIFDLQQRLPSMRLADNWLQEAKGRLAQMQELVGALNGKGKLREAYDTLYPIVSAKYADVRLDASTNTTGGASGTELRGGGPDHETLVFDFGGIPTRPRAEGSNAEECKVVDECMRGLWYDNGFWELEEGVWESINAGRAEGGLWGILA